MPDQLTRGEILSMSYPRIAWSWSCIVSLLALTLLLQSCAGIQTTKTPDKTLEQPLAPLQDKIASILAKPPFEYRVIRAAGGRIRAIKEYPGDPFGLPFLKKRMNERATLVVTLRSREDRPSNTDIFISLTLEERENVADPWDIKDDPEKKEGIIGNLIERLTSEEEEKVMHLQ